MSVTASTSTTLSPLEYYEYANKCEVAIELANTLRNTNQKIQVLLPLFKLLAHHNPTTAVKKLEEIQLDEALKKRYLRQIWKIELKKGSLKIPSDLEDKERFMLIEVLAKRDPKRAFEQTESISDTKLKAKALILIASRVVSKDQDEAKSLLEKAKALITSLIEIQKNSNIPDEFKIIELFVSVAEVEKEFDTLPLLPSLKRAKINLGSVKEALDSKKFGKTWCELYLRVARIDPDISQDALNPFEMAALFFLRDDFLTYFGFLLACAEVKITRCGIPTKIAFQKIKECFPKPSRKRSRQESYRTGVYFEAYCQFLKLQTKYNDQRGSKWTMTQLENIAFDQKDSFVQTNYLCTIAELDVDTNPKRAEGTLNCVQVFLRTMEKGNSRDNLTRRIFLIEGKLKLDSAQRTLEKIENSFIKEKALFEALQYEAQTQHRYNETYARLISIPFLQCNVAIEALKLMKQKSKESNSETASLGSSFDDNSPNQRTGSYSVGTL